MILFCRSSGAGRHGGGTVSILHQRLEQKKRTSGIAVCLFLWKSEHEVSVLVPRRVEPGSGIIA